jgi:hypothetical protein
VFHGSYESCKPVASPCIVDGDSMGLSSSMPDRMKCRRFITAAVLQRCTADQEITMPCRQMGVLRHIRIPAREPNKVEKPRNKTAQK